MFDLRKEILVLSEFEPVGIMLDLFCVGKLLQSLWLSRSIHKPKKNIFTRLFNKIFVRSFDKNDLPAKADPLFGLVEALKYMRFWCWATERCIERHGKDAPPELLELYEADRREYDRLTNENETE